MSESFRVDLGGVVNILSKHLYSSPRVYLRELIQNGVDAIVARQAVAPTAVRRITVTPADVDPQGQLRIADTGIGLTAAEIQELLATVGRSSKSSELVRGRGDQMGQFGIGLLSAFLVTDEIEVITRSVTGEGTIRWVGRSDGTHHSEPAPQREEIGSTVSLTPKAGARDLVELAQVRALLRMFATYLPCEIQVMTPSGPELITDRAFVWEDPELTGLSRRAAAADWCREQFGFDPLDIIELADPQTETRGMAFVLPTAATAGSHQVYLKRMLLSQNCSDILPDWAFFVRAVVNTGGLVPTANREGLYDDQVLQDVQDRLGQQLRGWLSRMAQTSPQRMARFMAVHALGVKAMAIQDDEMLATVATWLPFESTLGAMSLVDFTAMSPQVRFCASVEDFRQIRPIAASASEAIINAGYAYDLELIQRYCEVNNLEYQRVSPADLAGELEPAPDAERFDQVLTVAERVLSPGQMRAVVRSFGPSSIASLILTDRAARLEASRAATQASSDEIWGALLGSVAATDDRPWFVLNSQNPTVKCLVGVDDELVEDVVEALYAHALVMGNHPMRAFDTAITARALPALIERALNRGEATR